MRSNTYLILKVAFFFTIFLTTFYILEHGFTLDSPDKFLKPFLLSILTTIMLFKPNFKRYILFLVGICLVLMILASLFNLLSFSKIMGEFGFSLLIITIVLYIPQLIKKGQIERF